MKMQTVNITEENIEKIGKFFPNCLTEAKDDKGRIRMVIDFEKLKQELSEDAVGEGKERYQFTWPDKRHAIRLANTSISDTLRPCREESLNFDTTQNLYIEGDNLNVLKLLRENYLGKVKMIYIDPPYNTGGDFVYKDNFIRKNSDYKEISGSYDEEGNILVGELEKNTDSNGRFHTDWLNMIYPRLKVAKDLLCDNGAIFISIGVEEVTSLKAVCDEIFGEKNFIEIFSWVKTATPPSLAKKSRKTNEYILCYERNKSEIKYNGELLDGGDQPLLNTGNSIRVLKFPKETVYFKEDKYPNDNYQPFSGEKVDLLDEITIENGYSTCDFRLEGPFKWTQEFLNEEIKNGTTFIIKSRELSIRFIRAGEGFKRPTNYIKEKYTTPLIDKPNNNVGTNENASSYLNELMDGMDVFSYPKPVSLLKYLINFIIEENDIVMDFFAGSSTTADAVFRYNAESEHKKIRFINVQLPEDLDIALHNADTVTKPIIENAICFCDKYKFKHKLTELGKERIRRAGKKIKEESPLTTQDLDIGFRVLKLDSSNMEDVYYRPEESTEKTLFEDNIKPGRSSEDLLFQVMLECNLPLSAKIETEKIAGKEVFSVNEGYLIACFDEKVNEDVIKEVAKRKPYYFVMRDSSLATDNVADNFEQIWQAYSKDTIRRII